MLVGFKARLLLGLGLCISVLANASTEQFDEQLTLTPLRDGKIISRFSFKTLLQGASPRNPQTLGLDDSCTSVIIIEFYIV